MRLIGETHGGRPPNERLTTRQKHINHHSDYVHTHCFHPQYSEILGNAPSYLFYFENLRISVYKNTGNNDVDTHVHSLIGNIDNEAVTDFATVRGRELVLFFAGNQLQNR